MTARTALLRRVRARQELPPPARRRQIREAAGASIADLAEALHVTKQTVWLWETGKANPNANNVVAYTGLLADLEKAVQS